MHPFLKAQASSLTASIVDFTATIVLKEVFHIWYLAASVLGTITGGIVNFLINRNWVFETGNNHKVIVTEYGDKNRHVRLQAVRYLLVWTGNLGLNAAGVYLITHYCGVSYMISKIVVSLVVGISYNYLLQKRFVFSRV